MDDRERWRERVRDICTDGATYDEDNICIYIHIYREREKVK